MKTATVDSEASNHMTIGDLNCFYTFQPVPNGTTMRVADGSNLQVVGIGTIIISKDIVLKFMLYVPNQSTIYIIY